MNGALAPEHVLETYQFTALKLLNGRLGTEERKTISKPRSCDTEKEFFFVTTQAVNGIYTARTKTSQTFPCARDVKPKTISFSQDLFSFTLGIREEGKRWNCLSLQLLRSVRFIPAQGSSWMTKTCLHDLKTQFSGSSSRNERPAG